MAWVRCCGGAKKTYTWNGLTATWTNGLTMNVNGNIADTISSATDVLPENCRCNVALSIRRTSGMIAWHVQVSDADIATPVWTTIDQGTIQSDLEWSGAYSLANYAGQRVKFRIWISGGVGSVSIGQFKVTNA